MNDYCLNCKMMCEEIIPTYNCKQQQMTKTIDKKLEELIEERNKLAKVASGQADKIDALQQQLDALQQQVYQVRDEADDKTAGVNALTAKIAELAAELEVTKSAISADPIRLAPDAASVIKDYRSLTPEERVAVFQTLFSLGNYGEAIDNKLILISLIGSITLAMKKKNPEADPYMAIDKLIDLKALNNGITEEYKEILALYVGEFLGGVKTGNTFGIKSAADIKAKINEILQQYIPF